MTVPKVSKKCLVMRPFHYYYFQINVIYDHLLRAPCHEVGNGLDSSIDCVSMDRIGPGFRKLYVLDCIELDD